MARRLTAAAGMTVQPVPAIVFYGPRRFTVRRGGPPDVAVLPNPRALRRWLLRQPRILSPQQQDQIYAAGRLPATWC